MLFSEKDFPQLASLKKDKITYLDSAATSLKLKASLDAEYSFNSSKVANVHRGAHKLSSEATTLYEETRSQTASYLHCKSSQVIFTKGTTESVNLVAESIGDLIKAEDSILVTEMEHHANLIPWQRVAKKTGAKLIFCSVDENGELNIEEIKKIFTQHNVKLFSFTHMSNTLGTINPAKELISIAKSHNALTFVDGAQAVSALNINLEDLNPDFYAFSAHKIFGPFGLGVLYIKDTASLSPYQLGGAIIKNVEFNESTFLEGPQKFESGTPNIGAVLAFKENISFLSSLDFKQVRSHEIELLEQAKKGLSEIEGFQEFGTSPSKVNILSFYIENINSSDLCDLLDEQGVAIRSGHHCTQPLLKKFNLTGCARASFSIYNTKEDVNKLIDAAKKAVRMLK